MAGLDYSPKSLAAGPNGRSPWSAKCNLTSSGLFDPNMHFLGQKPHAQLPHIRVASTWR